MMANDSFTAKWSDRRMEGDEGLRTVECLRGRLLAERAASKAANDESEQIGKKVIELENQLKMEIKSRHKAEKRLKFLMKKLDSLNISYVSADESSSISEKSEISSVSSSKSQHQIELQKTQFSNISKCVTDTDTSGERHNCPSLEDNLGSSDEPIFENSNENVMQSCQKDGDEDDLKKEDINGSKYDITRNKNNSKEDDKDTYQNVDKSMALVKYEERNDECIFDESMALVVDVSIANRGIFDKSMSLVVDVPISNHGNVKDVLDALRYARESLQTSMDIKKHITLDRISC